MKNIIGNISNSGSQQFLSKKKIMCMIWLWLYDLKYKKTVSIRIYFPQNQEFLVMNFFFRSVRANMRIILISKGKKLIRQKEQLKLPEQLRNGESTLFLHRDYLNELLRHTQPILYGLSIHKIPWKFLVMKCYVDFKIL